MPTSAPPITSSLSRRPGRRKDYSKRVVVAIGLGLAAVPSLSIAMLSFRLSPSPIVIPPVSGNMPALNTMTRDDMTGLLATEAAAATSEATTSAAEKVMSRTDAAATEAALLSTPASGDVPTSNTMARDVAAVEIAATEEEEEEPPQATEADTATSTTDAPPATATAIPVQVTDPEILERIEYAKTVANEVKEDHPWFADFDFSTGWAAACGCNKCYYPSISDPTAGYLVARESQLPQMIKAHNLEISMEKDFGTARLSKSVELIANVTRSMAWVLKHYTRQWGYEKQVAAFSTSKTRKVVLQRVHKAPQPSLTVAFTPRKGGSMLKKIPWFIEQIKDPVAFAKQFRLEQQRMLRVMAAYSQLFTDMQFILDTTGRLYHIDLDRNGDDDEDVIITDKKELQEEVEWLDADLTWLLQHLTPSLLGPDEHIQKCQHSFCKKKKEKKSEE